MIYGIIILLIWLWTGFQGVAWIMKRDPESREASAGVVIYLIIAGPFTWLIILVTLLEEQDIGHKFVRWLYDKVKGEKIW